MIIQTSTNNEEGGTVIGAGVFEKDTTITLYAAPTLNFSFIGWTDGNNDNPRIVITDTNTVYTANFVYDNSEAYLEQITALQNDTATLHNQITSLQNSLMTCEANNVDLQGLLNECMNLTNIGSVQNVPLKIYPNPAKDEIIIENTDLNIENEVIQIIDLSSRIVSSPACSIFDSRISINVRNLSAGVYILKIGDFHRSFVKE